MGKIEAYNTVLQHIFKEEISRVREFIEQLEKSKLDPDQHYYLYNQQETIPELDEMEEVIDIEWAAQELEKRQADGINSRYEELWTDLRSVLLGI